MREPSERESDSGSLSLEELCLINGHNKISSSDSDEREGERERERDLLPFSLSALSLTAHTLKTQPEKDEQE